MLGLDFIYFPHSMSFLFLFLKKKYKNKIKFGEKMQNFYFFLLIAFKILHVFLPDISVVVH